MKRLLIASTILIHAGASLAQGNVINLHCVGELTETYVGQPTRTVTVERFYELSQNLVVQHWGATSTKRTRQEIEKKENDTGFKHSGYYKFEKNQIAYFEHLDAAFPFPIESDSSFQMNRQTGKWKASEIYDATHPERLVIDGSVISRKIYGDCEPWTNKGKF